MRNPARPGQTLVALEKQILQLMALGHTNREIADQLGVSVNTVQSENTRMFVKLGVRNRTEAVREARRRRMLKKTA